MCGIAGLVRRDGSAISDPSALAATFATALAHRGPDGSGAWTGPNRDVLLVHRRLAIIDLSADGAQPMMIDGRHLIVFNGEIYNYRELRRGLESRGVAFRTASDTEVLLRLLALEGPDALARARGMFALAWWDAAERSLVLARDRFGVKPLYVAAAPGSVAFASELRALRAARLVDAEPNAAAVLAYFAWGSVPPPLAWNNGAEMLEPGTWFEWRQDGGERRGQFADARHAYVAGAERAPDERAFRDHVSVAVQDSVHAHLVADVPVGVFLSGGIDSGALVSAATASGATDLRTFTVTFDDAASEGARAKQVADAFGTSHRELRVDAGSVADDLPQILSFLDQPTIDAVNTFYVSRAVASTGVKAVLSGAGGDELFGGYPSFTRLPLAMRAKKAAGPMWPVLAAAGAAVVPDRLQTRWRHFSTANGTSTEAYRAQRGFVLPEELRQIAGPAVLDARVRDEASMALDRAEHARLDPAGAEQPSASVARMESRLYLSSQLLRDMDVMSMAHGLEVRVPFVDHELQRAVWPELARFPSLMRGKRLLHETLAKPLPAAIVSHPKQGFTLPFATWMRADLSPIVRDGLQALSTAGWLNADAPTRIWDDWTAGRSHWSRPWGLAVMGLFLRAS